MYTLYHDRKSATIKVKKAHAGMRNANYTEDAEYYNDNYFICNKRKPLIELAEKIRSEWIIQLEKDLNVLKEIKF